MLYHVLANPSSASKQSSQQRSPSPPPQRKSAASASKVPSRQWSPSSLPQRKSAASSKEMTIVLSRLAAIEAQQRIHTQMLKSVIQALAKHDSQESCELPEDIRFPLETLDALRRLERKAHDNLELKALLVGTHCIKFHYC